MSLAPPPPGPTAELRPSLGKGALFGLLAAMAGGVVWFLLVVGTKRHILYGAIALGLLIGWAVVKGSQRSGPTPALIAALIAAATVIVSYYYIDRALFIRDAASVDGALDLPLFPTWTEFKAVLKAGFEAEGSQYLFSIVAVAAAAFLGFSGGSRRVRPTPPPRPYHPSGGTTQG